MKRQRRRPEIQSRMLSKAEAILYLGIGKTSMDKLISQGTIRVLRYDGIRKDFFDREELDGVIDRIKLLSAETLPTALPTREDKYGILRAAMGGSRHASH